jgi:hypothetical protein
VLGLTATHALVSGAVAAGLTIVGTFCWAWRHRCWRKTLVTLKETDRQTELELERERRKTQKALSHPAAKPSGRPPTGNL